MLVLMQHRPVILLVSHDDTSCLASLRDALTEQSARDFPSRILTQVEPLLTHHAIGVYIINFKEIVYHQHNVLYIIKSQRNTRWRVMICTFGDEIRLTAMIYQVCDLDKQKPHPVRMRFLLVDHLGLDSRANCALRSFAALTAI